MARQLNVIGAKLRFLRQRKEWTQAQLAAKCNLLGWDVSASTLAKLETHSRSAFDAELFILSRVLHVGVEELFPHRFHQGKLLDCANKPARVGKRRRNSADQ